MKLCSENKKKPTNPRGREIFFFNANEEGAFEKFEAMRGFAAREFNASMVQIHTSPKSIFEGFQKFQDMFNFIALEFSSTGNGRYNITMRSKESLDILGQKPKKFEALEAIAA